MRKHRRTKKRKSALEQNILWKCQDGILSCYGKTQCQTRVCLKRAENQSVCSSVFFFSLGSVLSSSWEAPDSAAYCRRMHGEPCFMRQKKCHEAVTEAAQWQTAQKTGGQLQLGNGTQGAVLHKELAAFSLFFQCAVHPQSHLGTLFLLCCHVSTATQQTGSQQQWQMQKDNCHINYVFALVTQCNVKLPSNNNNICLKMHWNWTQRDWLTTISCYIPINCL